MDKKKIVMVLLFCMCVSVFCFAQDLSFVGWKTWNGLQTTVNGNSVTINGQMNGAAGFVNEWLNVEALRGRTVTLEIRRGNSLFSEDKMIKITVNKNDQLVKPSNIISLIDEEYAPSSVTRIIFTLPNNFDGKLGFVFWQADLRNFVITATYN